MSEHGQSQPEPRPVWGRPLGDAQNAPVARDHLTAPGEQPADAADDTVGHLQWTPIAATPDQEMPPSPDGAAVFGGLSSLFGDEPDVAEHVVAPAATAPRREEHYLPEKVEAQVAPRPDEHFLPEQVDTTGDEAPAQESADLLSVFDTADTAPVQQEFATREDALAAWRQASEERSRHSAPPEENPDDARLRYRYLHAERLTDMVDRVLALAHSGDPVVVAGLGAMTLTRDAELDAAQRAEYERIMSPLMQTNYVNIGNPADVATVFDLAYDELIGIGPLGPLWREDDITEIMVSGPNKVTVERNGQLQNTPVKFRDLKHLQRLARDLAQKVDDRTVSRSNPTVTAQLPGARVQFVMAPIAAVTGVSIVIRKFRPLFGMEDLLRFSALTPEMAAFLSDVVASRANILVSGGTGSGKTTMINGLSSFIPDNERVITIEDALELQLSNSHVEQLLTKEAASGDDTVIIGQDQLLHATLRMRPDRIIVGEIRDGKGAAVMLQAANTGHDGTMTTIHANNPDLALSRLAGLVRAKEGMSADVAMAEVCSAFDVVVQVVRGRGGRRFVSHVSLLSGEKPGSTETLYSATYDGVAASPTFTKVAGLRSDTELAQRMHDAGLNPAAWH